MMDRAGVGLTGAQNGNERRVVMWRRQRAEENCLSPVWPTRLPGHPVAMADLRERHFE